MISFALLMITFWLLGFFAYLYDFNQQKKSKEAIICSYKQQARNRLAQGGSEGGKQ